MKVWVKWEDSIFVFAGPEDFLWDQAYRLVNDNVGGGGGLWDISKKRKKDVNLQIFINGSTKIYKMNIDKHEKILINDVRINEVSRPSIKLINASKPINNSIENDKIVIKVEIK